MIRLFVALRPPPPVRAALLDLMEGVPGARWQDDEQLHLTLRFVGEVDERQAEDLAGSLAQVAAAMPTMALAGVGCFGERARPHTLWAALAPREPLAALHRKVDAACVRAGLAPDRRAFLPHVTVARLSRGAGAGIAVDAWLQRHAGLSSQPFVCPHLVLYRSDLGRGGASYQALLRWPLGNPPPDGALVPY